MSYLTTTLQDRPGVLQGRGGQVPGKRGQALGDRGELHRQKDRVREAPLGCSDQTQVPRREPGQSDAAPTSIVSQRSGGLFFRESNSSGGHHETVLHQGLNSTVIETC